MSALMERLDSQQKRKLSRILGVPTSMEDAAEYFSQWEGLKVTAGEVAEYFADLKERLEESFCAAARNDNSYQLRDLKRRMWWKSPAMPAAAVYVPTPPETTKETLARKNRELTEELAYYKGFAEAAKLFTATRKGDK